MDVVTYTGTGATRNITGLAFSPDFVWIKRRDGGANYHILTDIVRGTDKQLFSNDTIAEESRTDRLTAFNSDGFTLGSYVDVNFSAYTYVGWAWDGGTSTVSNTQGSITSQVRANPTAGFSVVTYTGNSTGGATIGHGLGAAPKLIIFKCRDYVYQWLTYHGSLPNTSLLALDSTAAAVPSIPTFLNSTDPSSTVITLGSTVGVNESGRPYVAYVFSPVVGYSSMSSYTGNGSADGPFVYTGFRPKFIMVKRSDASGESWVIHDSTRDSYNGYSVELYPNSSAAEGGPYSPPIFDFLSNGFKIRSGGATAVNASGGTFIYLAVAESPFNYSRAR
jgi:hypothetical protein